MTMSLLMPFLPRIYFLRPPLGNRASLASGLEPHLGHCAALGFDHVLLAPPQDPGQIGEVARLCAAQGLRLLLDLAPGGTRDALLHSHPDWFTHDDPDLLPDPRRPASQGRMRPLLERPDLAEHISSYWQERLHAWIEAGVAGFRCLDLPQAPASFWRGLIALAKAGSPATRFLAWTPGCTPPTLDALGDCGFDASFSSVAWWDYRSRWLVEEQARLARVGPPVGFPDAPEQAVLARMPGYDELQARRRIFRRALFLAAATGNGMLVPMGFEYGLSYPAALQGQDQGGPASEWLQAHAAFDLSEEIKAANRFIAERGAQLYRAPLCMPGGTQSGLALLLRPAGDETLLLVANADPSHPLAIPESQLLERTGGLVRQERIWPDPAPVMPDGAVLDLEPAGLQVFITRRLAPVLVPLPPESESVAAATHAPRIAIEAIAPAADEGRFPVKRIVGDSVDIEADVFIDGHDKLAVVLLWRCADEEQWHETPMHALDNDRWRATLPLTRLGTYLFTVQAWRDGFATYRDELEKKSSAGLDVALELEEGRLLVEAAARHAGERGLVEAARVLAELASLIQDGQGGERIAALLGEPAEQAMREADPRAFAVQRDPALEIAVDRPAARFSSWYELFPRSQSGDPKRHGSFDDVIRRLPAIQAMGFDTLYFPPIHPIGKKHRKGRNNSLTPALDDPGSPYAIGSEQGGHDAIHPELGTLEDFQRLRDEAARHGLELALDFAIQCSPDHPWLAAHPEWFAWRPDGSIRYAENPPKKYQDIVNVDFYAAGAIPGLWLALRDVVLFWAGQGVRAFRVDNPHTKPLPFWEWMIAEVRRPYPDAIFLSEAFTRPKMMYRLAKVGFSQSYTYFTWRHGKDEFIQYLTELSTTPVREYFRPHFFVNTPDINPVFLQRSGRPGFLIRAALATTLSGLWGVYSGFELCEAAPVPGKEEYMDSEKYEIRAWDWRRPGNIIQEITVLNRIRRENPALQSHLGIRFLPASDEHILCFMKTTAPPGVRQRAGDNALLVAINLDPFAPHETTLELPLWEFGLPDDGALPVEDLVHGGSQAWHGKQRGLRLDPFVAPYGIWRVTPGRS
jgi:starch synthase (maltosyl-transferring)